MLLACLLALSACGGGALDDGSPAAGAMAEVLAAGAVPTPKLASIVDDAPAPTPLLGGAAALGALNQAQGQPDAMLRLTGGTPGCVIGFVDRASIAQPVAAPLPGTGGVFYSSADLARWRQRVAGTRFVLPNDVAPGTPGDWANIQANAKAFVAGSEAAWSATPNASRTAHGTLLRDAAFAQLIAPDAGRMAKLRARLLAEAGDPRNDLLAQCIRPADGSMLDAWFGEADWLLRYLAAYDFVRNALPADDRRAIDLFVRRNAFALAAQLDVGLGYIFPQRHAGNYAVRARSAAGDAGDTWATQQVDTNGDCRVDGADDPTAFAVYNYARADGSPGPRTSVLSQWFNNRKAISAAAIGAAGVMLGEPELTVRAKRYVMEWLTYSVWADGSEGEYLRNGDYCIPKQGVIYAASNIQSALLLSRLMARQGDRSLIDFHTRDGLFGTESAAGQPDKSIALVAGTHVRLLTGELKWFQHEAQRKAQSPRAATSLGTSEVHYLGDARGADDFHEIGLLIGERDLPALPIAGLVLRKPTVIARRFPGSTGLPVATGFGSGVGNWTDAFNALPAMMLLYADGSISDARRLALAEDPSQDLPASEAPTSRR
jgi:hypothetical protein